MNDVGHLLVSCLDRPGIVAAISRFFRDHSANIISLDQHSTDPEAGQFFMRLAFHRQQLQEIATQLEQAFQSDIAEPFNMQWRLNYAEQKLRTALFVSRHDHTLLELLWLWHKGELPMDISMVISNHDDLRSAVEYFDLPYHHIVDNDKLEAEAKILKLLQNKVDLIVLARYMQILSPEFVALYPQKIINIHHSFLPAFVGADPYKQAYEHGVKVIGATAHYVTADLDQGPIIEQDVAHVSHKHDIKALRALGRDLERNVLAKAVRWHLENRIIVNNNKTVVFS